MSNRNPAAIEAATPTPRTDHVSREARTFLHYEEVVSVEFARKLEREMAIVPSLTGETPRTEAECKRVTYAGENTSWISADFGRQLERELAAAKTALAEFLEQRDGLIIERDALRAVAVATVQWTKGGNVSPIYEAIATAQEKGLL